MSMFFLVTEVQTNNPVCPLFIINDGQIEPYAHPEDVLNAVSFSFDIHTPWCYLLKNRGICTVRVCVIDGQGGGIGSTIIKRLKEEFQEKIEIIALGTNSIATSAMLRAKANRGATGENAIVRTVPSVDIIIGSLGIVVANSMMGELTPKMAEAIASSPAKKCLLPLLQEKIEIIGVPTEPLPHLVECLIVNNLKELIKNV